MNHIVWILLGTGIGAAIAGWAIRDIISLAAKFFAKEEAILFAELKTPEQIAWGKATIALLKSENPQAESYVSSGVDWLIAKWPPLAPFRLTLIDGFKSLEAAIEPPQP